MVAEETGTDLFGEQIVSKATGSGSSIKIMVEQADMARALAIVKGSVSTKRDILPATTAVLLRAQESKISVVANNLSTATMVEIPATVDLAGECLIPYKLLAEFVGNLPKARFSITGDENVAKVVSGSFKASIRTLPAEEFPNTPMGEDGEFSLTVDGGLLRRALAQTVICTAEKDTRPGLNAVMFRGLEGGGLTLVGADGFRISMRQLGPIGDVIWTALVPREAISGLQEMLVKDEPVTVIVQKGRAPEGTSLTQFATLVVLSPKCKFLARLLAAPYPSFERMIPTGYTINIVCPTADIRQAIETVRPFVGGTDHIPVVFQIGTETIAISGENAQLGASMVEMPAEITGGIGRASLDPEYFADMFTVIDTEKVNIGYNVENKPISVIPMAGDPLAPDPTHLMLLMPRGKQPK